MNVGRTFAQTTSLPILIAVRNIALGGHFQIQGNNTAVHAGNYVTSRRLFIYGH